MIGLKRTFQETGSIHLLKSLPEPGCALLPQYSSTYRRIAVPPSDLMPLVDFDKWRRMETKIID
jgi:hypothetical protein